MKLLTIVIGFLVFSLVVSMMFAATSDVMSKNDNTDGSIKFLELSGDYDNLTGKFGDSDSVVRDMSNLTNQGPAGTLEADVGAFKGALAAGKMAINLYANFDTIITTVTEDVKGGNYIDSRITSAIIIILGIVVIFIIIQFLRAFKMET